MPAGGGACGPGDQDDSDGLEAARPALKASKANEKATRKPPALTSHDGPDAAARRGGRQSQPQAGSRTGPGASKAHTKHAQSDLRIATPKPGGIPREIPERQRPAGLVTGRGAGAAASTGGRGFLGGQVGEGGGDACDVCACDKLLARAARAKSSCSCCRPLAPSRRGRGKGMNPPPNPPRPTASPLFPRSQALSFSPTVWNDSWLPGSSGPEPGGPGRPGHCVGCAGPASRAWRGVGSLTAAHPSAAGAAPSQDGAG
jgi:hypothetical protein